MEEMGNRDVPFGKELYIERSDFFDLEGPEGEQNGGSPPRGFKRLLPGSQVRLKFAYVIRCDEVIREATTNEPIELKCTYIPETRSGVTPEGMKKVKGIIHWVEATTAVSCQVNQYDRLFSTEEPGKDSGDFLLDMNPDSLQVLDGVLVEPSVGRDATEKMKQMKEIGSTSAGSSNSQGPRVYPSELAYQFERSGYFALDKEATDESLVFNRVTTLRDTWASAGSGGKNGSSDNQVKGSGSQPNQGGKNHQQKQAPAGPVEDLRRVALRAVTILEAGPHPDAESLLVCKVDCGDVDEATNEPLEPRTVVAGLVGKIPTDDLVGSRVVALTNLKPAKMRGIESFAMLLAAASEDDSVVELLKVPDDVANGELITFEGKEPGQPDAMLKSKGAVKVWDRVKAGFKANGDGEATYVDGDGTAHRFMTSAGPVKTETLRNADIQ